MVRSGGIRLGFASHGGLELDLLATSSSAQMNISQTIMMGAACAGLLTPSMEHTIGVVVDCAPQLVTFFVDGLVCDGGGISKFGWFWTTPGMGRLLGDSSIDIAPDFTGGTLVEGGIYFRALFASELVGAYRATLKR